MDDLEKRVADHPGWYHALDLPGGIVTPGYCDLRTFGPEALPESLSGKRCLDVGTFDGFWAYSMEARGPEAVYALDLPDGTQADWPPNTRAENLAAVQASGLEWGSGFKLAHAALGSSVRRVEGNIYDLTPEWTDGPVDVVLCGTILQHLRDPTAALERMRDDARTRRDADHDRGVLGRPHPRAPQAAGRRVPPARPRVALHLVDPEPRSPPRVGDDCGLHRGSGRRGRQAQAAARVRQGRPVARLTFTSPA